MTIAEKIKKLQADEHNAYLHMQEVVLKEINGLRKRLGLYTVTYDEVMQAYTFETGSYKKDEETGKIIINNSAIRMLTAMVRVVYAIPYVAKARDKWSRLFSELQEVKKAVK